MADGSQAKVIFHSSGPVQTLNKHSHGKGTGGIQMMLKEKRKKTGGGKKENCQVILVLP